jgi:nucleoside-diphosphate-sugar epimerase
MKVHKVLVVGGAGYVGSILAEELLERGYAVRILDRLYYGDAGITNIRDRVELIKGDMRAVPDVVFEDVDAVINLGGLSNDPTAEYNPRANFEINTVATKNIAEQSRKAGIHRYIFASSCSIYDRGVGNDEKDVLLNEESEVDPRAAYSRSKYDAERLLLEMAGSDFCPVILRKGTIFGFSPRMRYDLVVNSFVKDALSKKCLTVHYGGEMWRPMLDIRDAARAYIACLQADEGAIRGQIFNVNFRNFRISELALRVREVLRQKGINADISPDYGYRGVRSYRVSAMKIEHALGIKPIVSIEESVGEMVEKIDQYNFTDFDNPRYYNIRWLKLLEESSSIVAITGSIF